MSTKNDSKKDYLMAAFAAVSKHDDKMDCVIRAVEQYLEAFAASKFQQNWTLRKSILRSEQSDKFKSAEFFLISQIEPAVGKVTDVRVEILSDGKVSIAHTYSCDKNRGAPYNAISNKLDVCPLASPEAIGKIISTIRDGYYSPLTVELEKFQHAGVQAAMKNDGGMA